MLLYNIYNIEGRIPLLIHSQVFVATVSKIIGHSMVWNMSLKYVIFCGI